MNPENWAGQVIGIAILLGIAYLFVINPAVTAVRNSRARIARLRAARDASTAERDALWRDQERELRALHADVARRAYLERAAYERERESRRSR